MNNKHGVASQFKHGVNFMNTYELSPKHLYQSSKSQYMIFLNDKTHKKSFCAQKNRIYVKAIFLCAYV